jgi:hypothetical protein
MRRISHRSLVACVLMLCGATTTSVSSAADKVVLQQESTTLNITINEQPFATYNFGSDLPKPFLLPVRTAAGVTVNRALGDVSDPDHPHHKGMWNAIDEVNGVKFWAEKGTIRNTSVKPPQDR